jgi:MoxR-like ATPase
MTDPSHDVTLALGKRLNEEVLQPMKSAFVAKDEIIDLMGVCLIGGENLFILGPPGTAKSALVHELGRRIDGNVFEYLLTRFTEPNEIFGPFDIRKLREGELVTNTEGMLPEATLVFLDELLNANSAILNSLLTVLNERVFRRGRDRRALPLLMVVGASNRLPDDDALRALFDRFLLRVQCNNVPTEQMADVLQAGWKLDMGLGEQRPTLQIDDLWKLHKLLSAVDFSGMQSKYVELVHRLRHAGIPISDRRAVKLQRLVGASALLCGRLRAEPSDLWVLRYIWETEEQQEVIASLVQASLASSTSEGRVHPRAQGIDAPDPESLARDLEHITKRLSDGTTPAADQAYLRDRLGLLAGRCEWVSDEQQRSFLLARVQELWSKCDGREGVANPTVVKGPAEGVHP